MRRPNRRAGFSMLEMVISAAIVSLLALVLMAANRPLTMTAREQAAAFDMDRAAARFLTQLRREVRQSGYNLTTNTISIDGTTNALTFYQRRSFGDALVGSTSPTVVVANWDPPITYALVSSTLGNFPDGTARFKLRRTQNGLVTDVLDGVQSLVFGVVAGLDVVTVNLVLARADPDWKGVGPGRTTRRYGEAIEYLNKPSAE